MKLSDVRHRSTYIKIKSFLSLLFASAVFLAICAGNGNCAERTIHWELAVGPGLNFDGNHTSQMLIAPAISIQGPKQWLQYRVEGDFELIDSDGQITAVIGAAPFLRFYMLNGESNPFFEIGAGANVISRNHTGDKDSGGSFIFSVMGGVGYEFTLYELPLTVSCRFRHISNACIYPHNESINNLYLLFSIGL